MGTGIAAYDILVHLGAEDGKKMVAVVGLGQLGTAAVHIAKKLGNTVLALSS